MDELGRCQTDAFRELPPFFGTQPWLMRQCVDVAVLSQLVNVWPVL